MEGTMKKIDVYLEVGQKRTFAGSIEWPGWCRSGRDEESALEALYTYAPRFSKSLGSLRPTFQAPSDISAFVVIERIAGNPTTDFGAPDKSPSSDIRPVEETELQRYQEMLMAFWGAFDNARTAARGKELRNGPRGGGRELMGILQHVLGADRAYLGKIGGKVKAVEELNPDEELRRTRQVILDALAAAVHGEMPAQGPRGGSRWTPRYFVRRSAWHVLDHAWEIEDRIL